MPGFQCLSRGRGIVVLIAICLLCAPLGAQEVAVEKVFAAVPYAQWLKQGARKELPWKVRVTRFGLSLHQRLLAHFDIELPGRELLKRPEGDRLIVLVEVIDASGKSFRDYSLFHLEKLPPQFRKAKVIVYWDLFVQPGAYDVTIVLFSDRTGEHNLMQTSLRIDPLKNDPLSGAWTGLPTVELLAPGLEGPDRLFRPDVSGKLHLPLPSQHPVHLELLADVTASDLFRGSTRFYNRYLSVALPLLKALSQIHLEHGTRTVAMLDLRHRRVTFEQDDGKELDWKHAKSVLAPENGPAVIDIQALEQSRESPAFLQDELLRRLNIPAADPQAGEERRVFVIIGSPMDFYSFRNLPHLPPGSEEKCVVYYLQFELLNPQYANGAIGNVRNMLKPLPLHVFKVRSAESIRYALAKILEEVAKM